MKAKKVIFFTLVLLVIFCLSSHMEAQESKRTFILVEVGGLLAGNAEGQPWEASQIQHNGKYFIGRVGLVHWLVPDKFDWFLAVGPAILTSGAPSKTFLTATSGFTMHYSGVYLGVGLTVATKETEGDWDETYFHLTANIGVDVFEMGSGQGSIFFEWQHPMRYKHARGKGGAEWYKAIVGVRILF